MAAEVSIPITSSSLDSFSFFWELICLRLEGPLSSLLHDCCPGLPFAAVLASLLARRLPGIAVSWILYSAFLSLPLIRGEEHLAVAPRGHWEVHSVKTLPSESVSIPCSPLTDSVAG